jgi:hypothetical protein
MMAAELNRTSLNTMHGSLGNASLLAKRGLTPA